MLITHLLLILEVWDGKLTYRKSLPGNLLVWSDLTLGSCFEVHCLLLVVEVCNVKPTYRESWAGILLVWTNLTLDPSFKVKRGYPNFKVLITRLLLVVEVWDANQPLGNHGLGIFWCGQI